MSRKLIIEGNAVYEIDEECMLKKRLDTDLNADKKQKEQKMRNDAEGNSSRL